MLIFDDLIKEKYMIEQFATSTETPAKKNLAEQLQREDMTLQEKLDLIDQCMKDREAEARDFAENTGSVYVPPDPADAFVCEGCS